MFTKFKGDAVKDSRLFSFLEPDRRSQRRKAGLSGRGAYDDKGRNANGYRTTAGQKELCFLSWDWLFTFKVKRCQGRGSYPPGIGQETA